jgi:hypothetical protein
MLAGLAHPRRSAVRAMVDLDEAPHNPVRALRYARLCCRTLQENAREGRKVTETISGLHALGGEAIHPFFALNNVVPVVGQVSA